MICRREAPLPDRGPFERPRPSVSLGAGEPASESIVECVRASSFLGFCDGAFVGRASEPRLDCANWSSEGDMAEVGRGAARRLCNCLVCMSVIYP